ncbi:MAG: cytidylate kinase-like family protein [Clostridia bacterium]|nr:cytidylate kinase-like family protein [Clostridia bacterium]
MSKKVIVTIARQFGSGGREIGEMVAKSLGFEYHDKSLISLAAEKSGINHEVLKNTDEKATPSFLYSIAMGGMGMVPFSHGMPYDTPINDKLFVLQSGIIEELAKSNSCVFIGRCADFVLRDFDNVVRVFIYADINKRAEEVAYRNNIPLNEAKNLAIKLDKKRANYYGYYTSKKWGRSENYDLMIDTTKIGKEGAAKIIEDFVKIIQNRVDFN